MAATNLNRVRLYSLVIAFPTMAIINYFILDYFTPATAPDDLFMPATINRTPLFIVFYLLLLAKTLFQAKKVAYDLDVIGLSKPWAAAFFTLRANFLPYLIFFAWMFLLQLSYPVGDFAGITIMMTAAFSILLFMLSLLSIMLLLMVLGAFTFGLLTIHLSTKNT